MKDQWTDRLSQYLDGELAAPERTTLEAHLASCDACRTTLEELRRVVTNARALDDRPPAADLWPAVAARIGLSPREQARPVVRRVSFTVPPLAADPANSYLNLHLAQEMRRKLELLRQAATLAGARS